MSVKLNGILGSWLEAKGFTVEMVDDDFLELKYNGQHVDTFSQGIASAAPLQEGAHKHLDSIKWTDDANQAAVSMDLQGVGGIHVFEVCPRCGYPGEK